MPSVLFTCCTITGSHDVLRTVVDFYKRKVLLKRAVMRVVIMSHSAQHKMLGWCEIDATTIRAYVAGRCINTYVPGPECVSWVFPA